MSEISVKELIADNDGWVFLVEIREEEDRTEHTVSLKKEYFNKLSNEREPQEFIKDAFNFLLERESKGSILKSFDISEISKYFSEFESII